MKRTRLPKPEPQIPITFEPRYLINADGDPDIAPQLRTPKSAFDIYKPHHGHRHDALAAYAWFILKHRCDPRELDRLFTKRIANWSDIKSAMRVE